MLSPIVFVAALASATGPLVQPHQHAGDPLMDPGVSHQLATRRAERISGVRYALHLDVTRPDTAVGHVAISFTRRGGGDVILDFRGPALSGVVSNGAPLPHAESNGAHVRIPAAVLRDGANVVQLDFTALIAPAGASIIRFHDETDGSDYLYTLLVPSDANALFPCFDQPDLKARVALTLDVRPTWTALGNGKVARVDSSGTRTSYAFNETEPLPTYLIAFAAGPWHRFVGGPRNTALYVRASRAHEVEVDSLQDQVASALQSMEDYFGISYPFQQFQYMLAPAFPFGGMEHPGVTMFNEESFIYREPPTLNQRLGRRATIYHEVAHQWFGDYVTMRWFDDLWLKEGFATYMAAKMTAEELALRDTANVQQQSVSNATNPWMSFYLRNKPSAYGVDRTTGTTPVWQELANLDQAKSNYGAIVYNKAPGVLKQLNYLVGDSAFRAGVHQFLTSHAYGNATWRNLLGAIGGAAHRSLDDWGAQYILRPGMPVIEQHVEIANGRVRRLMLIQHPAQKMSGAGVWPIRTELLLSRHGQEPLRIPVEITGDTTVVTAAAGQPAPDFVFANAGDYAYALVLLDARSAAWLTDNVGSVADPMLRAMLWGALWDEVQNTTLSPTTFITSAMRELPLETDEQIASRLVGYLAGATARYLSPAQRASVLPQVERLMLAGASDSAVIYGVRKSQLDTYIELASNPGDLARLTSWLDSTNAAGMPLRQPTRWAIVTQLISRGVEGAAELLAVEARHDTTTGGQRRAFVAGAARPDASSKAVYFERYFADSALNEDWVTASLRSFNDPQQSALTLPYLVPALDSLEWVQQNRRIFFLGSWVGAFIGGQHGPDALATVDGFLAAHPDLPTDLKQKILQTRDGLERTVRIRARWW